MLHSIEDEVRSLISEVLGENQRELQRLLISCNPRTINCRGACGETPAHIAIYKNYSLILSQLLQSGADPGVYNESGNNLIHISTLLGRIELLELLYSTGRCNLEAVNKQGQSPLDLSLSPYQEEDLLAAMLFKNWTYGEKEDNSKESIVQGRKLCHVFLLEKVLYDRESRLIRQRDATAEEMIHRDKCRRWMTDSTGKVRITYNAEIDFPTYQGEHVMTSEERDYLKLRKEAANTVVTRKFCSEQVMNSLFMNRNVTLNK